VDAGTHTLAVCSEDEREEKEKLKHAPSSMSSQHATASSISNLLLQFPV
jgi:hypothetical protein